MPDQGIRNKTGISNKKTVADSIFIYLCCLVFSIFVIGWRKFFIGIAVAPMGTIAELLGLGLVPFLIGWVIARIAGLLIKKVSFRQLWFAGSCLLFLLMLVGRYRASSGI